MNPVLINRWRGSSIESKHRGFVSVCQANGEEILSIGDVNRVHFPRSAIKFIQAIPFVESGAVEHYGLDSRHVALSCASHNGEYLHTNLVVNWLETLKLEEPDLECGAELPLHPETQFELIRSGGAPRRYHHNCSGKHMGFLSTSRYMGENTADYRLYHHPAQQRWLEIFAELASVEFAKLPYGYDGCGLPAIAMPGRVLATAMARFGNPVGLSQERKYAMQLILQSVADEPYLVAGADRLCTALNSETGRAVLVKTGADGCFTAVLTHEGYGISLKIDDGNKQASEVLLGAVLRYLQVIDQNQYESLQSYFKPDIANSRGDIVGHFEIASESGLS